MLGTLLRAASDFLFKLRNIIQLFLVDTTPELVYQVRVLGSVALAFLELRKVLNDALHIFNRFALGLAILVLKEPLDECVDGVCYIAEVAIHYLTEEVVIMAREHDLLHLL